MLQVVKDYTTWGELNSDVLSELIVLRGNLKGDVKITEAHVKTSTSYENIKQLAEAIVEGGFNYNELPNVKPIFRLNPPKKGYGGIKRSFKNGGALGYRGSEINKLIKKML
jgi:large subunit ribosomal protein L30